MVRVFDQLVEQLYAIERFVSIGTPSVLFEILNPFFKNQPVFSFFLAL